MPRFNIYDNKNIPEKCLRLLSSQKKLKDDNDNIERYLERYLDRPDKAFCNDKFATLNKLCYT